MEEEWGSVVLVGIDCAVDPRNVGIAVASLGAGRLYLRDVRAGTTCASMTEAIARELRAQESALVALDAPLGWPESLGRALVAHRAGDALGVEVDRMFRRATDDEVFARLGKRPLDVGADRIARTAHSALALLRGVRGATGLSIPIAWSPGPPTEPSAIEVYPAATMIGRGWSTKGYKDRRLGGPMREELVRSLRSEIEVPDELVEKLASSDHLLDATLCVLAAADFVRREVFEPGDDESVQREGWIWFRSRPPEDLDGHGGGA